VLLYVLALLYAAARSFAPRRSMVATVASFAPVATAAAAAAAAAATFGLPPARSEARIALSAVWRLTPCEAGLSILERGAILGWKVHSAISAAL